MSPSSSHLGAVMDKNESVRTKSSVLQLRDLPDLPDLPRNHESILTTGKSINVEGTNVVRVPFGIRQSRKKRPEKQDTWATLVLPFQPLGSPPTPPQAA